MSLGALSLDVQGIESEIKRLSQIREGKVSGINPNLVSSEDLKKLNSLEDFLGEPQSDPDKGYIYYGGQVYNRATSRDTYYSLKGRRFLFTNGLNRKQVSLLQRKFLLEAIEEDDK